MTDEKLELYFNVEEAKNGIDAYKSIIGGLETLLLISKSDSAKDGLALLISQYRLDLIKCEFRLKELNEELVNIDK